MGVQLRSGGVKSPCVLHHRIAELSRSRLAGFLTATAGADLIAYAATGHAHPIRVVNREAMRR